VNENQEDKKKAKVARGLVEKVGVIVMQLLDQLVKTAGAEFTTSLSVVGV
jgi:hypothetical protein